MIVLGGALTGRSFRIVRIVVDDQEYPIVHRTSPELHFTHDRFMASTGCNGIGGNYSVDRTGVLTVNGAGTTLMACNEAKMDQERRITKALRTGASMTLTGDSLVVQNGGVTLIGVDSGDLSPAAVGV